MLPDLAARNQACRDRRGGPDTAKNIAHLRDLDRQSNSARALANPPTTRTVLDAEHGHDAFRISQRTLRHARPPGMDPCRLTVGSAGVLRSAVNDLCFRVTGTALLPACRQLRIRKGLANLRR